MTILDYRGQPIKVPAKPSTERLPQPSRLGRFESYLSGSLTPGFVARALQAAESGQIVNQAALFDRMLERDGRLRGLVQARSNAIRGLNWQVEPAGDSAKDKEIADFCTETLTACQSFRAGLGRLNRAVGQGFAALENFWDFHDGRHVITKVQEIRQVNFIQDAQTRELRLRTEGAAWQGEVIPPFRLALHRHDSLSDSVGDTGLFRTIVWLWMFKHYSLKDFSVFCEVFGMPFRLGKYGPNASEGDKETLRAAIQSLGTDAAGIINSGTEIEFIEAASKGKGSNPHIEMINLVNAEMAIAILGQVLTTDPGDRGTQALGTVHNEVRLDLVEGDAVGLADTVRSEFLRPLVIFNFGEDAPVPLFSLPVPRPVDTEREAKVIEISARAGVKLSQAHARERLGIPEPGENDELVVPPGMAGPQAPPLAAKRTLKNERRELGSLVEDPGGVEVEQAVGPHLEAGLAAMDTFEFRVREMVEADNFLLAIDDIVDFAQAVKACLGRADSGGRTEAQDEMEKSLRRLAAGPEKVSEFIPHRASNFFRVQAFSVATITQKNLATAIKGSLQKAIDQGRTRRDFAAEVDNEFDRLGMSRLRPWHMNTVFQTNFLGAHSAARWAAFSEPGLDELFPLYQYLTAGDEAVRASHAAMHGRIWPRDHEIWKTWWPPNGFKCRCKVSPISRYEAEERGLAPDPEDSPINLATGRALAPDKGFATNPGVTTKALERWISGNLPPGAVATTWALTPWAEKAARIPPEPLAGKTRGDLRAGIDKLFPAGAARNYAGEKIIVGADLVDTLDTGQLRLMPLAAEALREPDEAWGVIKNNQAIEAYLAKFAPADGEAGFIAVKVIDGRLVETRFLPVDAAASMSEQRRGVLLFQGKAAR